MSKYFYEKAPVIAPGVVEEIDTSTGEFVVRHYDGRYFDINGDEIYDYEDD